MKISLVSTGSALPEKVLTNDALSEMVETSDQWIRERSGICERRVLSGENLTDLMVEASKKALADAHMDAEELELIIVATFTAESIIPSAAGAVREGLGLDRCVAFDVNAACTGFIFGLSVARGLMETMGYKNALVIGAEALSKVTDWTDRSTCVLFGDGAGAAILKADSGSGDFLSLYLEGISDKEHVLATPSPLGDTPFYTHEKGPKFTSMNGKAVFRFAVAAFCRSIKTVLEKARLTAADIQWIVPHQANIRIIDYAISKLGFPKEKYIVNIDRYGNTSAASIPIALDDLFRGGKLRRGDRVILAAFGGGLTAGAVLFEY